MRQPTIAIAAGKGGTGKTLLATSLAAALNAAAPGSVQLLDCDVEEPNAHILLHPQFQSTEPVCILMPEPDEGLCTACGECARVCQAHAIALMRSQLLTFPDLCTGCGACALVCPVRAIVEREYRVGEVSIGATPEGIPFVTGALDVGIQRATPIAKAVRRHIRPDLTAILDAPPGTACSMQETIEGADYCILVTEPTPFGLENLRQAVATCQRMGVRCGVVVNRDGIGDEQVTDYCSREGLELLLRIPHERSIAEAYSRGETVAHAFPEWIPPLQQVFDRVRIVAQGR